VSSSSSASCGAAASWLDVAAWKGHRCGLFLLCSEGWRVMLEGGEEIGLGH